jgi:hypothetical protein
LASTGRRKRFGELLRWDLRGRLEGEPKATDASRAGGTDRVMSDPSSPLASSTQEASGTGQSLCNAWL